MSSEIRKAYRRLCDVYGYWAPYNLEEFVQRARSSGFTAEAADLQKALDAR